MDPLDNLMGWLALHGALGLLAIGLAERFIPVLPSYGMLLAIGIEAAEGTWSLPTAFVAMTSGSFLGCAVCFYAIRRMEQARSMRLLIAVGRLFGMPGSKVERWTESYRRNGTSLAFSLQLVPTIRLLAPAFAGLLFEPSRSFLIASAAGIMVWNGLFLGIGYAAAHAIGSPNSTVLALTALGLLLVGEMTVLQLVRRVRAR